MSYLEMHEISKYFPGVQALNSVDFDAEKGEVHAIAGENGAGKSTLIKILAGSYLPDGGKITLDEKEIQITSPLVGRRAGITVIYQELALIPYISIAENIFLSSMPKNFVKINWKEMNRRTREAMREIGFDLDPKRLVKGLSVVQQQAVEIAKILVEEAKIVVMDEPTALLPEREVQTLFNLIKTLKKKGVTVIYISHRLNEIFEIADRVTVLKDGEKVGTERVSKINQEKLIQMMIGRKLSDRVYRDAAKKQVLEKAPVILSVDNLKYEDIVKNVSLQLKKGEILGIAGLVGSGKSELIQSIFGGKKPDTGEIQINGKKISVSPLSSLKNSMGLLPSDRKGQGLNLKTNITHNVSITNLEKFSKLSVINEKKEKKTTSVLTNRLNVKAYSNQQLVNTLSGGNQQKVVMAKWLLPDCKILLFDEPTRGIDVGARSEIYELMTDYVKQGGSVLLVSSDTIELLAICDRIIVMRNGSISETFDGEDATEEKIVHAMF